MQHPAALDPLTLRTPNVATLAILGYVRQQPQEWKDALLPVTKLSARVTESKLAQRLTLCTAAAPREVAVVVTLASLALPLHQ